MVTGSVGSLTRVRNKDGIITAIGIVTVQSGETWCTVTHNLGTPPNYYDATPLDDISDTGGWFIDNVDGRTLTMEIHSATPGDDHRFLVIAWYIAGGN